MPKIYSPKLLAITLHYHVIARCRALGTATLLGKSRNPLNFGADPCCHGNEIWPRRGDLDAYRLVNISVSLRSLSYDCRLSSFQYEISMLQQF